MSCNRVRHWLLWLSLLGVQACSFDVVEPESVATNRCSNHSDCPGATCTMGMCIAAASSALPIILEVTPTSAAYGTEPSAIVLPPFVFDGVDAPVMTVPDALRVFGNVRVDGRPSAAVLRFVPMASSNVVATRPVTATTMESPASITPDETADYAVTLLRDTAYQITVTSSDEVVLPPLHLTLEGTGGAMKRLDVVYDPAVFHELQVQVSGLPTGEWSVAAVQPGTTDELSTRVVVPSDGARVVLHSVEALNEFDLLVTPGAVESNTLLALPAFRVPRAALTELQPDVSVVQLVPLARSVPFAGTIEHCRDLLQEPEVESRPAMAVALRSRALLGDNGEALASASFSTTATATYDPGLREWRFNAEVPAGQYEVVVTPAIDSGCGVFAETREIQAPEAGVTAAALLQLPLRSFLSGRVLGGYGMAPVVGATLVANALGLRDAIALEPNDDAVTRYNRTQQTATGMFGEFMLPIDLGAYDVLIKPPPESGFAWHVLRDVNVGARTETPFDREVVLAAPVVLRGTLRTPSGETAMASATVRAYTTTADAERGERAIPIGTATADARGEFELLLPASIDRGWY